MIFYLGTHHPHWLGLTDVPLFVSARRLRGRRSLPRALGPWALDSGAFTELKTYGRWTVPAARYAAEVRRFRDGVGGLAWAAPQDWMCEPAVIGGGAFGRERFAGTGLSVREHQRLTLENYLTLRHLAPDLPWVPVLQGWAHDDYLRHAYDYRAHGVVLPDLPLVGLGSVCRRQGTLMAEDLVRELHGLGLRLHAFGYKTEGLPGCAAYLASSDSMAWSLDARWGESLPGCAHATCANCLAYALGWRERVVRLADAARNVRQPTLF